MDIYKSNYQRSHISTASYLSYLGREGLKQPSAPASQYPNRYSKHTPLSSSIARSAEIPEALRVNIDYHSCFAMEKDLPAALRSINKSKLSSIVRRAVNRPDFQIKGWRARNLDGKSGNPTSLGTYRFEGVGVERNEWLDWSVILKVIQSPSNLGYINTGEGEDPNQWNYWKRDLLIYQSGWLDGLPDGISAPQCYEALEVPGNIAGIWLEDIADSYSSTWPLHRYALAARHLGRLNGIYISRRDLPTFSWLGKQRIRQWLSSFSWEDFPWDHPQVWQQYPNPELDSFRNLLQDHQRFLAKLEQLPKTINLGDTNPANLSSRHSPKKSEQTVALDWSLAGIEPVGDDLGQLVYGTYKNLRIYRISDISDTLFTSYINGLQDSGCKIDPQLVRFGYVTSAAFRVGLSRLVLLSEQLDRSSDLNPQSGYKTIIPQPFESAMADEAYRLLDWV
jgi:hypothetical protein